MRVTVDRRRLLGHRVLGRPPRPRPRGDARLPRSGAGGGDRARRAATRATSRTSICTGSPRRRSRTRPSPRRTSPSSPCRARRSARRSRRCPARCPILSLTKGLDPATGDRLSTLVTDRPVAVLSGPNIAEEISRGLPAAAVIAGEDHALSRPDPARDHLADVPGLRQRRRRRRRAVRRREERDRARRRRGRRARPRRQREGRARRPRPRRDGRASPRRPGARPGDVRRASPGWAT